MTRILLKLALGLLGMHGAAMAQDAVHQHAVPSAPVLPTDSASDASWVTVPRVSGNESEREHVAPLPPSSTPTPGSHDAMAITMGMDDTARFGFFRFDQAEYQKGDRLAWDIDGWYGGDYNRLWIKSEGERERGAWDGRVEALWSRVVSRWWSSQVGVRRDFGNGTRTWLAAGVEGLAPYFFDVEATAYVGDEGRLAARLSATYDLLLTQRLVLQPNLELSAFNKTDAQFRQGAGMSSAALGLRLRYEFRRELAPYAGLEWTRAFGKTAELLRTDGDPSREVRWVAGIRVWF